MAITLATGSAYAISLKLPDLASCKPVYDACMKAGQKGKDTGTCVDKLKNGGSVKDVKIDPDALKKCVMSAKK